MSTQNQYQYQDQSFVEVTAQKLRVRGRQGLVHFGTWLGAALLGLLLLKLFGLFWGSTILAVLLIGIAMGLPVWIDWMRTVLVRGIDQNYNSAVSSSEPRKMIEALQAAVSAIDASECRDRHTDMVLFTRENHIRRYYDTFLNLIGRLQVIDQQMPQHEHDGSQEDVALHQRLEVVRGELSEVISEINKKTGGLGEGIWRIRYYYWNRFITAAWTPGLLALAFAVWCFWRGAF